MDRQVREQRMRSYIWELKKLAYLRDHPSEPLSGQVDVDEAGHADQAPAELPKKRGEPLPYDLVKPHEFGLLREVEE